MSSSDVGAVISAVQWGEEGSYVREVAARGPLPQLAKVIKGQYLGVGVASLASPGLASTLLLLPASSGVRIAAQCVKFKEGRRVVGVGPKLAIPDAFDGYFEILSEDGRAVRCMESVAELAKRFPDSTLVRETLTAFVSRSDDVETITEKSRAVAAGETLVLVGEVVGNRSGKSHNRFLRCFDQAGQNVYLPYDARGKFSAIAKEDNISGVHSVRNLLNKRLPLMVRLVHGRPPVGAKVGHFLPELRLFAALTEQPLAALPLGKDTPLVLLPPAAPLKLVHARNADQVEKTKEFMRLCERGTANLLDVSDRIHVYDISLGGKGGMRDPRFSHWPDQGKHKHPRGSRTKSPPSNSKTNPDDYDEIDQIYDYVRGFAPLPRHIRSPYASDPPPRRTSKTEKTEKTDTRPTPPPIETIPTRRPDPRPPEKLSPSVHPALISAALDRAHRRVEKRRKSSSGHEKEDKAEKTGDKAVDKVENKITLEQKGALEKLEATKIAKDHGTQRTSLKERNGIKIGQDHSVKIGPELKLSEQIRPEMRVIETKDMKIEGSVGKAKDLKIEGSVGKAANKLEPNSGKEKIDAKKSISKNNKLFVKAVQQRSQKNRVLRHKSASPTKEAFDVASLGGASVGMVASPNGPPGGNASTNGGPGHSGTPGASGGSPSPLFRLRYKSLTNLTLDCDTLDSSGSGGRDSGGSGGSGSVVGKTRIPEKRSRRLVRPRSLTDLAFGRTGPPPCRALVEAERRLRLEPGVYRHAAPTPRHARPMAPQKIGTLYL